MNKRRIDVNQLKKIAAKGKKIRAITVKYQTVLSFFKQKDAKDLPVFQVSFTPLINDLLSQLAAVQFVSKLEKESKDSLKTIPVIGSVLKLESFQLKTLSKQYPIQQLCGCLVVQGTERKSLSIIRSKLMSFFKYLRAIYSDFCYCSGEKLIVDSSEWKILYEMFLTTWNKYEEKGRFNESEKLERRLCRSLHFLGILIENNILEEIDNTERKKREEEQECGTRSEHKKNIKGVVQQGSTVHSFASLDPSTMSLRLKSEASQEEHFPSNNISQYSQKSEKIVSRSRFQLWEKAELRQLKFGVDMQRGVTKQWQVNKYQINYLSNDVENILIQQAFKMQRFSDSCERNEIVSTHQYCLVDYGNPTNGLYHAYPQLFNPMSNPLGYLQYDLGQPINQMPMFSIGMHSGVNPELSPLKRGGFGFANLVQTRKNDRYQ